MEHPARMDGDLLAGHPAGIFIVPCSMGHRTERDLLGGHGHRAVMEHLAGKSLGGETAYQLRSRLFGLVLGREVPLANPASKLAICCFN